MTMQTNSATKRPRRMAREPQPVPSNAPMPINEPIATKPQTKASLVEGMLQNEPGATLDDMCQATGWQPHTCRAFLTGLRKKGKSLERCKREDGSTIYKLIVLKAAA